MYLVELIDGTYDFMGRPPPYPARVVKWAERCRDVFSATCYTVDKLYNNNLSCYQANNRMYHLANDIANLFLPDWQPNITSVVAPLLQPIPQYTFYPDPHAQQSAIFSSGTPSRSIASLRDWAIAGANIRITLKGKDMGVNASYRNEEEHFEGEDCIDKADRWLSEQFRRQK